MGNKNQTHKTLDFFSFESDTNMFLSLGNDHIHDITTGGNYRLTIRLTDWDNVTKYANYSTFQIADESKGYRLRASDYSGDAGKFKTQ